MPGDVFDSLVVLIGDILAAFTAAVGSIVPSDTITTVTDALMRVLG